MRIAVIAHVRFAVAQPFMGGMEAHCASLCDGLVARGHQVTLFAAPGSRTAAELVEICPAPYETVLPWKDWRGSAELNAFQAEAFGQAWRMIVAGGFDVAHNNALFPGMIEWADRDTVPLLTSQHVPPFGAMRDAVRAAAGNALLQFSVTSRSQEQLWFDVPPSNLACVHNGIDTQLRRPGDAGRRLLWSGRITPNKGTAHALRAAHRAGVALDIIGSMEDEVYFAREVAPLLDADRSYLGHLSGEALRARMAGARALVATPMWDEPFGLVAAEALSCDIPVIAFDRGALREVVGDCGVLCPPGDVAALAAAMRDCPVLPRGQARRRAERFFSIDAMISGYERLYAASIAEARARRDAR